MMVLSSLTELQEATRRLTQAATNQEEAHMAYAHFTELFCKRQQDVFGVDEPLIWVGGRFEWNGVAKKGEGDTQLNLRVEFADSVLVELKEGNGPGATDGKLLQAWTIHATPVGPRPALVAKGPGYEYYLWYHVD